MPLLQIFYKILTITSILKILTSSVVDVPSFKIWKYVCLAFASEKLEQKFLQLVRENAINISTTTTASIHYI